VSSAPRDVPAGRRRPGPYRRRRWHGPADPEPPAAPALDRAAAHRRGRGGAVRPGAGQVRRLRRAVGRRHGALGRLHRLGRRAAAVRHQTAVGTGGGRDRPVHRWRPRLVLGGLDHRPAPGRGLGRRRRLPRLLPCDHRRDAAHAAPVGPRSGHHRGAGRHDPGHRLRAARCRVPHPAQRAGRHAADARPLRHPQLPGDGPRPDDGRPADVDRPGASPAQLHVPRGRFDDHVRRRRRLPAAEPGRDLRTRGAGSTSPGRCPRPCSPRRRCTPRPRSCCSRCRDRRRRA
jgi:hypothetical protein